MIKAALGRFGPASGLVDHPQRRHSHFGVSRLFAVPLLLGPAGRRRCCCIYRLIRCTLSFGFHWFAAGVIRRRHAIFSTCSVCLWRAFVCHGFRFPLRLQNICQRRWTRWSRPRLTSCGSTSAPALAPAGRNGWEALDEHPHLRLKWVGDLLSAVHPGASCCALRAPNGG